MKLTTMETYGRRMIEKMLMLPFPYTEILRKQVNSATLTYEDLTDLFAIHFLVDANAPRLPRWLRTVPLSWQILTSDIPVLCQLFVADGYIVQLEILDMGGQPLDWKKVLYGEVFRELEYTEETVLKHLTPKKICICKARQFGSELDWMLMEPEENVVVSFWECQVRNLSIPFQGHLKITKIEGGGYTVYSDHGEIDFECKLLYLNYATRF